MVDRLVRPRPLAAFAAFAAAFAVLAALPACGRYDGQQVDTTPDLDTDLGDDTVATSASTGGGTTTTTTATSGDAGCDDACPAVDAVACDDAGVITCELADGCLRWSGPAACGGGERCEAGECVPEASTRFDAVSHWRVPEGGAAGLGFNGMSGAAIELGDAFWSVVDLDGDHALDLVVTARAVAQQDVKWLQRTLGYPNAPYWEVYRGGEGGFADAPIAWSVPSGGHQGHGLVGVTGTPELLGDAWWTLLDVDGDGLTELVITGHSTVFDGWIGRPLGYPDAPYWEVYRGDGGGFAATPEVWALPAGGPADHGYYSHEERAPYYVGDPAWTTRDLDGDGYVDLVVTAKVIEFTNKGESILGGLGAAMEPIWEVYRGGPGGFAAAPIAWSVPIGGRTAGGFVLAEGEPVALGDERWRLADLDGDGRDDLVIVASVVGVGPDMNLLIAGPGHPEAPHWWFHRSRGDGFDRSAAAWTLPIGGQAIGGFVDLKGAAAAAGDDAWVLRDVDGDRRLELVITGHRVDMKGLQCEARALGVADGAPRWDVHEPILLGFETVARPFAIPDVGECGLHADAGAPLAGGDPAWTTVDVDGDRRPDLVLTGEAADDESPAPIVFNHQQGPRWRLHRGVP